MDTNNENRSENSLGEGFGEFFNTTAESGGTDAPDAPSGSQAPGGRPGRPAVPGRDSAGTGRGGGAPGGAYGGEPGMAEYREFRDRVGAQASHHGPSSQHPGGLGSLGGGSPNFGLQRKSGRRRVVGGSTSLKTTAGAVVKSYKTASGMQFNDVEELRSDAISRAFAQEILEKLWEIWGLDTGVPEVMRKAEDVVYALFAMRTASPDADFDVVVALGDSEVNLLDLSKILASEEVTRRRFARAVADDIRTYVSEPDNVKLREMLVTELGVKAEYATLAFDGSTHCSGMSTNQVMFTKQLEQMNLFDTPDVRDRMASNQQLATAGFQVNNKRSAYK